MNPEVDQPTILEDAEPINVGEAVVMPLEDNVVRTPSGGTVPRTGSPSQSYSYPVATFVHNLVRTSMGPASSGATIIANGLQNLRMSSHSSTGGTPPPPTPPMPTAQAMDALESAEMMDDMDIILVDGDLVQVPRSTIAAGHDEDEPPDTLQQQPVEEEAADSLQQQCRPHAHKVKKGSRRLLQWMKRRKDKKKHAKQQHQNVSLSPTASETSHTTPPPRAGEEAAAAVEEVFTSARTYLTAEETGDLRDTSTSPPSSSRRGGWSGLRLGSSNTTFHTAEELGSERSRSSGDQESPHGWGFGLRKRRGRRHPKSQAPELPPQDAGEGRARLDTWSPPDSQDALDHASRRRVDSWSPRDEQNNSSLRALETIQSISEADTSVAGAATSHHPPTISESYAVEASASSEPPPFRQEEIHGYAAAETSNYQSVVASFMGTTDDVKLAEGAILPVVGEVAYICGGLDEKKDEYMPYSLLSNTADLKVDKGDSPDTDAMLRRAAYDMAADLDSSNDEDADHLGKRHRVGKSDGSSVPLSQARRGDTVVHNDVLKVLLVAAPEIEKSWLAQAIAGEKYSEKLPRPNTLRVDVHKWEPESFDLKVKIWEVSGAHVNANDGGANFGAHPGTQSLFFSDRALYCLVWDLAANNPDTAYDEYFEDRDGGDDSDSDYDDGYGYGDEFLREETNRQAEQALAADIQNRVISWVENIRQRAPCSAILPIVLVPTSMKESEVRRRCETMQNMLEQHLSRFADDEPVPKLLSTTDDIVCVDKGSGFGVEQIQDKILSIATRSLPAGLDHVGTPLPPGTLKVRELTRKLKKRNKFILVDYILGELGDTLSVDEVYEALRFLSSIGEILYFGVAEDEVLSRCVILCRRWLVSALSCILRNDLKCDLSDTRAFMMMQGIYSGQDYSQNEVTKALTSGVNSNCPVLSASDAQMLWQSMKFMREAADRFSKLSEESATDEPTMYYFLERLLIHVGIFLPLEVLPPSISVPSQVFFVPSLLSPNDSADAWTFKSRESWKTTLCHTWLLRDGASSELMESISVRVLKDLYCLSDSPSTVRPQRLQRSQTFPEGPDTAGNDSIHSDSQQELSRFQIDLVMCWKSSMRVKVSSFFVDPNTGTLEESYIDVFVAIVDPSSSHCIASNSMRGSMQRVVVSGKGQVGERGRKLWKGGYQVVLDSVRDSLSGLANMTSQVVCPDCLIHSSPQNACTWNWDGVLAVAQSENSEITCIRGHAVNSHLVCGICTEDQLMMPVPPPLSKPVAEILPSIVLVGLWDPERKCVCVVGSGFVIDRKRGLVVTAAHVLFDLNDGKDFGLRYFGRRDAQVVVGVLANGRREAVWRYVGDVVADDIPNVDACVIQIQARLENDVDDEGPGCANEAEHLVTDMSSENLQALKMSDQFELDEHICILGFNQGGEGILQQGEHINRSAEITKGFVCKQFKSALPVDGSHQTLTPREEIVIQCPTIGGHSGGPCVNGRGIVIGILSRSDPVETNRCYLVPTSELRPLVQEAQRQCSLTKKKKKFRKSV